MQIDHLIYTTSSLEKGMDEIEALLGVRPVIGGRHPAYGTHNALLSLGDSTYLEVMAPDPGLPTPARGRLLAASYLGESRLTTWVLRSNNIEDLYAKAKASGSPLGPVESGQREKPDGSVLTWKLTDPYAFPLQGTIPFLIDWGTTPHPAQSLPSGGQLIKLIIRHPNPSQVHKGLALLNVTLDIEASEDVEIVAQIKLASGEMIRLK